MDSFEPKTSFIPKTNFTGGGRKTFYKEAGVGLIFKLFGFLFFVSLLSFGGAYLYKNNLSKQIEEIQPSLQRAKDALEPAVVNDLEKAMASLTVVKKLVNEHRLSSHIFKFLEDSTYEEIRYKSFSYAHAIERVASEGGIAVDLQGEAKSYTALAKQTEILKITPSVKGFSLGNFSLTPSGNVGFSLKLSIDPAILKYKND